LGVIDRHALPRAAFDAYFEAKTFEFYNDAFPDTTALEAYCGETSSAILQLASLILDGSAAKACADISGHGGVALGIARIIERLARTRSKGQCYLPQDLMSACGLSRDDFVAGENKAAIKHATDGLSALGISHYEKWRALMKAAPKSVKPAFLPVAAARHLLVKAQKSAHAPAFQLVQISAMRRLLAITKAALI
jgi:phytoene synthase